MSLATRCFACGTVFRVVQDQLKVSEGWVRCGRCNEVFNALETLFDLDRDAAPEWSPSEPGAIVAPSPDAPTHDNVGAVSERIDAPWSPPRRREIDSTPAARVNERDRLDFPDAQFEPDPIEPDSIAWATPSTTETARPEPEPEPESAAPPAPPEFLREAERRERWQHPLARAALGTAAVLLVGALTLQAAHQFRDLIAAHWPATKPALLAWCSVAGCTIEAPKRIDDIVVENTALTRSSDTEPFKLAVTLRNRGSVALGIPSIDLSLTDASGQLVARRVLGPREFRASTAAIAPGTELPLQLMLSAGSTGVAGYTVELFYP